MARYLSNKPETHRVSATRAFKLVDKVLDETLALSRRYAPVRQPRIGDRRPVGRLRASLRKRGPRTLRTQVAGSVGSTLPYAASVHEGAKPHLIRARRARALSFFWEREAVQFVGFQVRHPGVRRASRTQYLWLPLTLVARRNGFRVQRNAAAQRGTGSVLP